MLHSAAAATAWPEELETKAGSTSLNLPPKTTTFPPKAPTAEQEEEEEDDDVIIEGEATTTAAKTLSSVNSDSGGIDSCLECSEAEDDEEEEEEEDAHPGPPSLDQRHLNAVHEELEKLNIATDVINKLEVQLDAARANFREVQNSWSEKLKELSKKYGSSIAKARPYYQAQVQERKLREESQRAAIRFERASNLLAVAKQQVQLTQDSLSRQSNVHPECLEVLNHHIQRVSEAEAERVAAEEQHRSYAEKMITMAASISSMEKEQRSAIKKSRAYFESALEFSRVLDRQKALILQLEAEVRQKKCDYATSLSNLERISDSIHEQRSLGGASARSAGGGAKAAVGIKGAESAPDGPPPYRPTAPPAYDDHRFDRRDGAHFVISPPEDQQEVDAVLSLLDEEGAEKAGRSLGSGVILLAQQLMGGGRRGEDDRHKEKFDLSGSQTDVSYHTTLPEGSLPIHSSTSSSLHSMGESGESSEVSSLASGRLDCTMTDEALSGMLRSHSTLISEIDGCAERVESLLKRSFSDADPESGVESTTGSSN